MARNFLPEGAGGKLQTVPAFTDEEYTRAHLYLATQVANMMGRKMEEDDWGYVYCKAKNIPRASWSNLNIDVMYKNLSVEHKMLRRCLVPECDGVSYPDLPSKEKLWDRYYTVAPAQQRQFVGRSSVVKKA